MIGMVGATMREARVISQYNNEMVYLVTEE